jgi:sugar/nucleoside kinase (ribokinase family)
MSKRVGVGGGLSIDHLVVVDAGSKFSQLGGPGLYAALGARLVDGVDPILSARLPANEARFDRLFNAVGIDTTFCAATATVPKVWILNAPEGRRIVGTAPHGLELDDKDLDDEPDDEPVAPNGFYASLDGLLESSPRRHPAVGAAVCVGIDPHQLLMKRRGIDHLRDVTPQDAVLLPSRVQLRMIDSDPRCAARRIARELGCGVVARLDADGMYVIDGTRNWTLHDEAVQVIETTGAGDSSAAATVAALTLGADLVSAALFGISVARLALSAWGHSGLVRHDPISAPLSRITTTQEAPQ